MKQIIKNYYDNHYTLFSLFNKDNRKEAGKKLAICFLISEAVKLLNVGIFSIVQKITATKAKEKTDLIWDDKELTPEEKQENVVSIDNKYLSIDSIAGVIIIIANYIEQILIVTKISKKNK